MRPIRVAIVSASAEIVGGHSVQARSLARELTREGFDVRLVAIDRPFPRGLKWVKTIRGLRTGINEYLYAMALTSMTSVDVAHVFSASYWSFLLSAAPALLAARLVGCRVVLHYHSGEVADHLDRWGLLVHPWLKLADEIVVCSAFQAKAFAAHGHRVSVIPNVVDLARFRFRRREPLAPRFICTRNLEPIYGVDVVIDAFALIRTRCPRATLVVAGSGSAERRLKEQAERVAGHAITFLGSVAPDGMPVLLDGHDVYLNASTVDNQPVSLLEAQAAGLAIVSTNTGGIPEVLLDGRAGVIVPARSPSAMAEAALELIERPIHAMSLIEAGRSAMGRFTWEAVGSEWARLYGVGAGRRRASPAEVPEVHA